MTAFDPDQERALYPKYRVEKIGGETPGWCFVLAPETDRHAKVALAAYAASCAADYPYLARDLYAKLGLHSAGTPR